MSKKMQFFIYLLERYAESKNMNTQEVILQWDTLELTYFIYEMYDLYHIESIENAFKDINRMVMKKTINA